MSPISREAQPFVKRQRGYPEPREAARAARERPQDRGLARELLLTGLGVGVVAGGVSADETVE